MIEKIKNFFLQISKKLDVIIAEQKLTRNLIEESNKDRFDTNSLKLLRHALGSIDTIDKEENGKWTPQGRKEFCARIMSNNQDILLVLRMLSKEQERFSMRESECWEQVIFSRGTLNGFDLMIEKINGYVDEHKQNLKDIQDNENEEKIGIVKMI